MLNIQVVPEPVWELTAPIVQPCRKTFETVGPAGLVRSVTVKYPQARILSTGIVGSALIAEVTALSIAALDFEGFMYFGTFAPPRASAELAWGIFTGVTVGDPMRIKM